MQAEGHRFDPDKLHTFLILLVSISNYSKLLFVNIFLKILLFLVISFSLEAKLPTYPVGEYPSKYSQVWVFYEKEWRKGQSEIILRPFYSSYEHDLSAHKYKTSLYPIFYSEKTNHWNRWTFLFIFSHDSTLHDDTGDDSDLVLSPLFQWDWSHKEFKARSILWPFFVWGSSDIRSEVRVFPFYSQKRHIAKFEHTTLLWPFIQWGKDFLDKKEPTSYSFFFPFYNIKSSLYGNMESRAFIWFPILGSLVGYGYDRKTSEVNYNFLFFLIQYGYSNNRDYRKHIFFPFYGYSRFASKLLLLHCM